MLPFIQAPLPSVASAPQLSTYLEAETALLSAMDNGLELPAAPHLESGARPYAWLMGAATWKVGTALPANPFAKGSKEFKEAEALRSFLGTGESVAKLPLHLSGSRLLLWTWLRNRDRTSPLPKPARIAVENRLLKGGPMMLQGWALRHALCFTVAEKDNARFSALKVSHGKDAPDTIAAVQALFGLMGGPSPTFRLWQLPSLQYQDATLGELGASRVWVCPPGIDVPEGAAWIIPSAHGNQNGREAQLDAGMEKEAKELLPELKGRKAWFAASRTEWEADSLVWFPILIELDKDGNMASVKMGDAAP